MENYWQNKHIPKNIRLIKMLFGILLSIVVVFVIGVFVIQVNETVEVSKGEIAASNPPMEYIAPFDVESPEIRVKEGDFVFEGDTLGILHNRQLRRDVYSTEHEIEMLYENIEIYEDIAANLKRKARYLRKNKYNLSKRRKSATKLNEAEIASLRQQLNVSKEEFKIAKKSYRIDSLLFINKVIAKKELDKTAQNYLTARRTYEVLSKTADKEKIRKKDTDYDYVGQINNEQLKSINADQEYLNTKNEAVKLKQQLQTATTNLIFQKNLMKQQYLIASENGYVQLLFNAKRAMNFFAKGSPIMIVTPKKKQSFYAKLILSQQSIKDIKIHQKVHLRLDAYDVMKYGVTKGRISYLSEGNEANEFYALVDITEENKHYKLKNGYKTKADIILDKVSLLEFILKRLFQSHEPESENIETTKQAKK